MKVHLVGVGGAGVSALALFFLARGDRVSGCDLASSETTRRLTELGLTFERGHGVGHIVDQDLVVYSGAAGSVTEVKAAAARGVRVLSRARCLAGLFERERSVAVCGTHGKTTVTLMLGQILGRAGWSPTVLVGDGASSSVGESDWLIAEADESDGSLDLHHPRHALVTNLEFDHPDHFQGVEEVEALFERFLGRLPEGGIAAVCADDERLARLATRSRRVTYGFREGSDYRCLPAGFERAWVVLPGGEREALRLSVPGLHNLQNATGAFALAVELGVESQVALAALAEFRGAKRRLERLGSLQGAQLYDDYAHHPTEVKAALQAARELEGGRVLAVFQPHRYSRYAAFERAFADSLKGADAVLVTEIYAAGEPARRGVTARGLASLAGCDFAADLAAAKQWIRSHAVAGDLVLLMGAGDLRGLGLELAQQG